MKLPMARKGLKLTMHSAWAAALFLGAWFFGIEGGAVGPFDNEAKCNEIRALYVDKLTGLPRFRTPCWYFGGVFYEPKPVQR